MPLRSSIGALGPEWQQGYPPDPLEADAQIKKEGQRRRLQEILGLWRQYPGRAPGGTGLTGLSSFDAPGWSQIQNEQVEAMRLMGRTPQIESAPLRELHDEPAPSPESWYFNPDVPGSPSRTALRRGITGAPRPQQSELLSRLRRATWGLG